MLQAEWEESRWSGEGGIPGGGDSKGKVPEVSWVCSRAGRMPNGWSIRRSGKIDAGGAQGARQGQVVTRGFNFKRCKNHLRIFFFFKQGRNMSRFAFLKKLLWLQRAKWVWSDQVGGHCGTSLPVRVAVGGLL